MGETVRETTDPGVTPTAYKSIGVDEVTPEMTTLKGRENKRVLFRLGTVVWLVAIVTDPVCEDAAA